MLPWSSLLLLKPYYKKIVLTINLASTSDVLNLLYNPWLLLYYSTQECILILKCFSSCRSTIVIDEAYEQTIATDILMDIL